MALRIVVLISGGGSNMLALVDACGRGDVRGEVVAVASDRECNGLKVAGSRGIPAELVAPSDYGSRDDWSAALRDVVARYEPDLVVSAGFMRILAPVFVDAFWGRLINLHPALLPAFPGAHAVRDALDAGVRVTGSTVHFVDNQVDHGPIVAQEAVRVDVADDEASLHDKIKAVEHRLLPEACRLILEGRAKLDGTRVVFT